MPVVSDRLRLHDVRRQLAPERGTVRAARRLAVGSDVDDDVHADEGHRQRLRASPEPGGAIAQNWLDLDAEHGPSSFDQRHQFRFNGQLQHRARAWAAARCGPDCKGTLLNGWTHEREPDRRQRNTAVADLSA